MQRLSKNNVATTGHVSPNLTAYVTEKLLLLRWKGRQFEFLKFVRICENYELFPLPRYRPTMICVGPLRSRGFGRSPLLIPLLLAWMLILSKHGPTPVGNTNKTLTGVKTREAQMRYSTDAITHLAADLVTSIWVNKVPFISLIHSSNT